MGLDGDSAVGAEHILWSGEIGLDVTDQVLNRTVDDLFIGGGDGGLPAVWQRCEALGALRLLLVAGRYELRRWKYLGG